MAASRTTGGGDAGHVEDDQLPKYNMQHDRTTSSYVHPTTCLTIHPSFLTYAS